MFIYFTEKTLSDSGITVLKVFFFAGLGNASVSNYLKILYNEAK
jgi:hypothetical protein